MLGLGGLGGSNVERRVHGEVCDFRVGRGVQVCGRCRRLLVVRGGLRFFVRNYRGEFVLSFLILAARVPPASALGARLLLLGDHSYFGRSWLLDVETLIEVNCIVHLLLLCLGLGNCFGHHKIFSGWRYHSGLFFDRAS